MTSGSGPTPTPPVPPPVPPAVPPALPPAADPPSGGWAVPPPPPGPPPRPPLRRSRSDRVLGGVCGGLAEYTGIDALLWRVGAIALTVAGGSGVLVYLLLWLLMPAGPRGPESPAVPATGTPRAARTGPRSPVPGVTAAALLILVGVVVLLHQVTGWHPGARGVLGTALLVVGIGLSVAAVTGAGRIAKGGLIGLGFVLALALVAASTVHLPDRTFGHVGNRTWTPATAADVRAVYSGGVGDTTLDLTALDLSALSAPVTTRLDAGVGDVEVRVPRSADVQVSVDSGIGDVDVLPDEPVSGGIYAGHGSPWSGDGTPEIRLTVHAGVGDVEVSRG